MARPFAPALLAALVSSLLGCASTPDSPKEPPLAAGELRSVATSPEHQWTGLAVSARGRIFVSYPRWFGPHELSVAEILPGGELRAFPDTTWNSWTPEQGTQPREQFACVQAVFVDGRDRLWILDSGAPKFEGPIEGGPKLVQVDLERNRVARVYRFDREITPPGAYLNDLRIDMRGGHAVITDSGLGGLVVLHLASGRAHRVLAGHPSTLADPDVHLEVEGVPLVSPAGDPVRVQADGIAMDARGEWVYYQALTARRLYRVPVALLIEPNVRADILARAVEDLGPTVATDGMEMDASGNIYFAAFERGAVLVRRPDGTIEHLCSGPEVSWPDTLVVRGGELWFTTARIHEGPPFGPGIRGPYGVWRTALPGPAR
ncbi:MAG: SMP-30/gluconolactonase/LRE family protein [Phycisphaerales bacterium]|nr:SMP-30/gluconolactonase/LRE family protein [Phycisphaerales bacterium]